MRGVAWMGAGKLASKYPVNHLEPARLAPPGLGRPAGPGWRAPGSASLGGAGGRPASGAAIHCR